MVRRNPYKKKDKKKRRGSKTRFLKWESKKGKKEERNLC